MIARRIPALIEALHALEQAAVQVQTLAALAYEPAAHKLARQQAIEAQLMVSQYNERLTDDRP